jgi:hypothetical protein
MEENEEADKNYISNLLEKESGSRELDSVIEGEKMTELRKAGERVKWCGYVLLVIAWLNIKHISYVVLQEYWHH